MKSILINGVSAKSGGGKSILTNFLTSIKHKEIDLKYIVIVPPNHNYEKFKNENVIIIPFNDSKFSGIAQLYFYFVYVKKIIKRYNIELVFNLSDVIIRHKTKQLFLFDWPYGVYPESSVWQKMPFFEFFYRKFKLFLFKNSVIFPTTIYAQTFSVRERLSRLYTIDKIGIFPNAVSIDNIEGGVYKDFMFPENRTKFLCLSKYYVHKNIEIFLPLARLIKLNNLAYSIVVTIEKSQHRNAKKLLETIIEEKLENIIINVGAVDMEHVPSLYKQVDALLLPTLLESFSGTYVEAMHHLKPIFTSDMDFAKDVCGEAAIYFNALNAYEVFNAIKQFSDESLMKEMISAGEKRLGSFLSWEDVSERILNEIKRNI